MAVLETVQMGTVTGLSGVRCGLGEFCRRGPLLAEVPNQLDRRQMKVMALRLALEAARLCGGHM